MDPEGVELSPTPVLQARGLIKRYGRVTALDNADFDLYPGEILARGIDVPQDGSRTSRGQRHAAVRCARGDRGGRNAVDRMYR